MKAKIKNPIHGWINLNKPLGITSAAAVNKVKWLLKPSKIGHAGTLDPLASGVLPLALGEGTKCVNLLMDAKKTYEFSVTFGERRSTEDAEGEVIATSEVMPTEAQILAVLPQFTGEISQMPPIYSALKVDGKRAYDLARAGEDVVLEKRTVIIHRLEFLGFAEVAGKASSPCGGRACPALVAGLEGGAASVALNLPRPLTQLSPAGGEGLFAAPTLPQTPPPQPSPIGGGSKTAHFRAIVSKGTYIRSLGRDIAQALGSEGYISRLHRSAVGPFTDTAAISLDFLEESVHKASTLGDAPWLTPLERALNDISVLSLAGEQWNQLRHGQRVMLATHHPDTPQLALLVDGKLVGLARVEGNQVISNRLLNV